MVEAEAQMEEQEAQRINSYAGSGQYEDGAREADQNNVTVTNHFLNTEPGSSQEDENSNDPASPLPESPASIIRHNPTQHEEVTALPHQLNLPKPRITHRSRNRKPARPVKRYGPLKPTNPQKRARNKAPNNTARTAARPFALPAFLQEPAPQPGTTTFESHANIVASRISNGAAKWEGVVRQQRLAKAIAGMSLLAGLGAARSERVGGVGTHANADAGNDDVRGEYTAREAAPKRRRLR